MCFRRPYMHMPSSNDSHLGVSEIGGTLFWEVLIVRILLVVRYYNRVPLFSETPILRWHEVVFKVPSPGP